jgi:hypothetical protein
VPDFSPKHGVLSGTYFVAVEGIDELVVTVKFFGFDDPEEVSNFIYWLETVLSDPLDKVIH